MTWTRTQLARASARTIPGVTAALSAVLPLLAPVLRAREELRLPRERAVVGTNRVSLPRPVVMPVGGLAMRAGLRAEAAARRWLLADESPEFVPVHIVADATDASSPVRPPRWRTSSPTNSIFGPDECRWGSSGTLTVTVIDACTLGISITGANLAATDPNSSPNGLCSGPDDATGTFTVSVIGMGDPISQ
jgi:hypothetical protein